VEDLLNKVAVLEIHLNDIN